MCGLAKTVRGLPTKYHLQGLLTLGQWAIGYEAPDRNRVRVEWCQFQHEFETLLSLDKA